MRDNLLSKERAHRMNSVELDKYYIENPDKKNDISQPYALFHFGIKWIPDAIAGYNNANGFIVQRIRNEAPDFLSGYSCKDYYEAWSIENGEVVYPKDKQIVGTEDDVFQYPPEGVEESLFQYGTIKYLADVYWIDESSPLYEIVNQWEYNKVQQAGNLIRSTESFKECNIAPVFSRPPFSFRFDCRDEEVVFKTVYSFGRNMYSGNRKSDRDNFALQYKDIFIKFGKIDLFNHIIRRLEMEFGR